MAIMLYEVTNFGTNAKPISNLLYVNNSNLPCIVYEICWITGPILVPQRQMPLFNTITLG